MKNDKKCPLCSGQGWLAVVDKYNMPIQAQCKYCGGSGKLFDYLIKGKQPPKEVIESELYEICERVLFNLSKILHITNNMRLRCCLRPN